MAGTVEHLAIALELMKRWDATKKRDDTKRRYDTKNWDDTRKRDNAKRWDGTKEWAYTAGLEHPELFLAGNVCPDGIQARNNYQRSMKMHTHFRDGIPDYEFGFPGHLEIFHHRILQFAREHWRVDAPDRELYLGYVTHILADEVFMLTIRPEFMGKIAILGLTDRDAETFEHFTFDVNQIDFRLAQEYPGMDKAYNILKNSRPYAIDGMVTEEELTRSREWILDFFFEHAPEPEEPVYYTYGRALQFIREAVDFIEANIQNYIKR